MKSAPTLGEPHPHARRHFALAGLALAVAAGLGAPAAARALSASAHVPIELPWMGLAAIVAVAFLSVGWAIGRRFDQLSDEARRDPVTKVGNRRCWEECLSREVERAARAKMPLSLMVLDVDHLKQLNDAGGHLTGDRALALVGKVLATSSRSRDVAARFGGDEFAVLLPRTRAAEARIVAERIRTELSNERRGHGPLLRQLSVSIGICELSAIAEPRPSLLFEAADRALYVAKQSGRNRVVVFERPTSRGSRVILLDERRRNRKRPTRS